MALINCSVVMDVLLPSAVVVAVVLVVISAVDAGTVEGTVVISVGGAVVVVGIT